MPRASPGRGGIGGRALRLHGPGGGYLCDGRQRPDHVLCRAPMEAGGPRAGCSQV